MIPNPTFSVIIAAYNAAQTIVAAVESAFSQTWKPHEVIVVDDGSTDATSKIVETHFGGTVRLISRSKNEGPASARNRGVSAATGSHWAFLDADDTWHREKLNRVAGVLSTYPKAAMVFHSYAVGTSQRSLPAEPALASKVIRESMLVRNRIATPCAVVRTMRLRFDKRMRYLEDFDFFLRCFEKGPVYFLPEALTFLGRPVLSAGGQSSNRWAMRKGELRAYTKFAKAHKAYLPLLPVLWSFSLLKHLRSGLMY